MRKAVILEKMKASIILPTYNEKENAVNMIRQIKQILKKDFEIIVVDDNSPDGTSEEVLSLNNKNLRLIKRVGERGLVSAIQKGIDEAKGDIIIWMDCDLSHPPSLIPKLVEAINLQGYDVATASRYLKGGKDRRTFLRVAYSRLLNKFASLLLTPSITDYTTGFVAGKREVFLGIRLLGSYGEYCMKFLYDAFRVGFKIKELPYEFTDRTVGETKTAGSFLAMARHGWNYGTMVLKLRFRK